MFRLIAAIFLVFSVAGCNSTSKPAFPDWKMVYHHDKNGNAIAGDKQQLLNLIAEGRPVRIYWPIKNRLDHYFDAGFLTVINGEAFAQVSSIVKQIPDFSENSRIALDAKAQSKWTAIMSTSGEFRSFQSVEAKLKDYQFELKWFVFTAD